MPPRPRRFRRRVVDFDDQRHEIEGSDSPVPFHQPHLSISSSHAALVKAPEALPNVDQVDAGPPAGVCPGASLNLDKKAFPVESESSIRTTECGDYGVEGIAQRGLIIQQNDIHATLPQKDKVLDKSKRGNTTNHPPIGIPDTWGVQPPAGELILVRTSTVDGLPESGVRKLRDAPFIPDANE